MTHNVEGIHNDETSTVEEGWMEKEVAHVPPAAGTRSLWVFGELQLCKVPSHRTGGAYSLFEVVTQPGGGPPAHVQHREDESFYVLEGEFEFISGEKNVQVGASSLLYIPKGTLHAHKNIGEAVGRMLMSQTPGGLYERFFEEVGKPVGAEAGPLAEEARLNSETIAAIGVEYGIEIPLRVAQRGRA